MKLRGWAAALVLALVAHSVHVASEAATGCTKDTECAKPGTDNWKCGKTDLGESGAKCTAALDKEQLKSECSCWAPECAPVSFRSESTGKSKVLFIGDAKLSILAVTLGVRYSNVYDVFSATEDAFAMNLHWANGCFDKWLSVGSASSVEYIVIGLGRTDSSDTFGRSESAEEFQKRFLAFLNKIVERAPKAKVVVLPVIPPAADAEVKHFKRERILEFNAAMKTASADTANFCDITGPKGFGAASLCGDGTGAMKPERCKIAGDDELYPQGTPIQHSSDELAADFSFGFTTKEGDMLLIKYLNKCMMYAQPFERLKTAASIVETPAPVQAFLSPAGKVWVRFRRRIRVRVRVRRRVRIRVRRRVRVRGYWAPAGR